MKVNVILLYPWKLTVFWLTWLHVLALLEAVRESNRNKVSALAEDNWMFEAEDQPRLA